MDMFVINGGNKLSGTVKIPGAKNSVLPILAATVISGKKSLITDCPKIKDVELTIEILKDLGCEVEWTREGLLVDSKNINTTTIKEELMDKMRSSIIFTGAIIARKKHVKTSYPGGCELGLRPIDLHIKAFKELGISVHEKHGYIECDGSSMKPHEIHLDFPSVGATENIMLAASTLSGKTKIVNAAKEPEICDLQEFLLKMGVKIKGAGTSIIEIEGTNEFSDVTHKVIPDRIVASTYIAATAVTGGKTELTNVICDHLGGVISVFKDMGVIIVPTSESSVFVTANSKLKPLNLLRTSPYPGFPTDSQSIVTSTLIIAGGTSMIVENIFEQRFKLVDELRKMGADIGVDGRCAVVKGVDNLFGAKVCAPDLRSGAALVVAGLAATGKTEVTNINYIERGYEDIAADLRKLGADIYKVTAKG